METNERVGEASEEFGCDFDVKADVMYELIMSKLDEIQGAELMRIGKSNGFKLFGLLSRKVDPPREDLAFDMGTKVHVLGKHSRRNFSQTVRFIAMLEQMLK